MQESNKPPKAYRNMDFLNSRDARTIRILSEYLEPMSRFRKYKIKHSIVFFGSARSADIETTKSEIFEPDKSDPLYVQLKQKNKYKMKLAEYYEDAVLLSKKLTEWSLDTDEKTKQSHYICSGGGPGMMEAANKGSMLAGGKSIGLNISIPTEQFANSYISKDLSFEFHYFFIRKFWFVYFAQALIIFPGGFGTLDELTEVMTLLQTQKIKRKIPIVIYGSEYWKEIINIDAMVKWGTISEEDAQLIYFCDTVDDAFNYLTKRLKK